jgi:hypothetical protein
MMGQVAVKLEINACAGELFLQFVDTFCRKELVLCRPVCLYGHLDGPRIKILQWRHAIEHHARRQLGNGIQRQQRQRPAHAETGDADLLRVALEVLHGTANVLTGRIGKVELFHQVMGFLFFYGHRAAIQVRNQHHIARGSQAISNAANLFVQPPPFLNDHNPRRAFALGGRGQVTTEVLTVRAFEGNHLCGLVRY